jgi:hypothetical protein
VSKPSGHMAALLAVAIVVAAPAARAWVERTVRSDSVTIDVSRDGTAVVTHEILLAVRGGPLPEIAVEPVDADAELLEGATVTRAQSGHAAGLPLPLSATKMGARVVLRIVGQKGIRSGTHQIRFSYRTNLDAAGKLQPGRTSTSVEWTGPSFADGIDSARVVFRVPRGSVPPRLASARPGADPVTMTDDAEGVFLGTFRRAVDKDELEVVRPHMAKGEAVPWRITVDASTFDVTPEPKVEEPQAELAPPLVKASAPKLAPDRRPVWAAISVLAVVLATVVVMKSRWVEEACRRRAARARPLLPVPSPVRGLLAAAFGVGAAVAVIGSTEPLLAAGALLVSMAFATHLPPRLSAALRGPGTWVRLDADAAFAPRPRSERLPGRFVDVGTVPGFALFFACLALFVAAAIVVSRTSPYEAICVALGSAILFPIFCTGRGGELPPKSSVAPQELLEWLVGSLESSATLELHPLGRVPQGGTEHDELRLLVRPLPALPGFVALEVGIDFHQGLLGLLPLPYVIVRVHENTEAAEALPKGLLWTRGRNADERVAVLRPKVPTRKITLKLVQHLVRRLRAPGASEGRQRGKPSSSRSMGNGQSTAKAGTPASPAHAT